MGLPYARVELADEAFGCRVWLIHDDLGEVEVSSFCQAVRKEAGSPKVVLELCANNGCEELERGFSVDVNTGVNEVSRIPVVYYDGTPYELEGAA